MKRKIIELRKFVVHTQNNKAREKICKHIVQVRTLTQKKARKRKHAIKAYN